MKPYWNDNEHVEDEESREAFEKALEADDRRDRLTNR